LGSRQTALRQTAGRVDLPSLMGISPIIRLRFPGLPQSKPIPHVVAATMRQFGLRAETNHGHAF
jgi:hypothetical protein